MAGHDELVVEDDSGFRVQYFCQMVFWIRHLDVEGGLHIFAHLLSEMHYLSTNICPCSTGCLWYLDGAIPMPIGVPWLLDLDPSSVMLEEWHWLFDGWTSHQKMFLLRQVNKFVNCVI